MSSSKKKTSSKRSLRKKPLYNGKKATDVTMETSGVNNLSNTTQILIAQENEKEENYDVCHLTTNHSSIEPIRTRDTTTQDTPTQDTPTQDTPTQDTPTDGGQVTITVPEEATVLSDKALLEGIVMVARAGRGSELHLLLGGGVLLSCIRVAWVSILSFSFSINIREHGFSFLKCMY